MVESNETQAQESFEDYHALFTALPLTSIHIQPVFASATQPLQRAQLEQIQPSGVFVCGGNTPLYQQSLCLESMGKAMPIVFGGTANHSYMCQSILQRKPYRSMNSYNGCSKP